MIKYIDLVDLADLADYKTVILINICFFIVKKKNFDSVTISDVIDDNISIKIFKIKSQIIK